jgi:hypothetical protein
MNTRMQIMREAPVETRRTHQTLMPWSAVMYFWWMIFCSSSLFSGRPENRVLSKRGLRGSRTVPCVLTQARTEGALFTAL